MPKEIIPSRLALQVEQMRVGESAFVEPSYIVIDEHRHAFILKVTSTGPSFDNAKTVKITREERGYVIDIKNANFTWNTQIINASVIQNYIPIEDIVE